MWRPRGVQWFAKPFVFFSLIMLLKIYLAKMVVFPDGAPWLPLVTDLPAVWAVFLLIEWWGPKRKFGAYLTADLLLTCIYFAVIMYYKYFGIIVTYHALQQAGQVTEVQGSVMSLLHPYYLLVFADIVVFLTLMSTARRFRAWARSLAVREPARLAASLLVVMLAVCLAGVWQSRDSMNELRKSQNMGIVPYELYEIAGGLKEAFTVSEAGAGTPKDVTRSAIEAAKGIREPVQTPMYWGRAKGRNVIVIQLEAFQKFLLNYRLDGVEVTPNLNRLLGETLYFPHFYQMVGQGNTADAEFVVNTSLYIPKHGAASQEFGDRVLPGMPRTLAANGYDTATFHTNDAKFWNREALYPALGFQRYYDKKFFGEDDMVFFGSSDELLYDKVSGELERMNRSGRPFYAQIVSMSAHHPFNVPDHKIRLQLPDRFQGTLVGDYLQAQNYADYALGQWVERLKRDGLWDNSVVVIYGDHMGVPLYSLGDHERELMKEIFGREYGPADMLNIPLLVSVPGMKEPMVLPQTGGQADIYPTVANLLGISLKDQVYFGQDLLNQQLNLLPQRYYLPSGSFVGDDGIFVPGEGFGDGKVHPFDGKPAAGAAVTEDQYLRALKLLQMSDRYVQSLPQREKP